MKVATRYLASILTNTDDKAEDLTVYCQAYIYRSGSLLPILCSGFKAI